MANAIWVVDPFHTEIELQFRYMSINKIRGRFQEIALKTEEDEHGSLIHQGSNLWIKTASLELGDEERRQQLLSEPFLDAGNHPWIQLSINQTSLDGEEGSMTAEAHLTLKGHENPVSVIFELGGREHQDIFGLRREGFSFSFEIKRTNFGMTQEEQTEEGVPVIGKKFRFNGELELMPQEDLEAMMKNFQ